MGNIYANLFNNYFEKTEEKILMIGIYSSGKTTILNSMQKLLGKMIPPTPTVGFNAENITYNNTNFTVWDVDGSDVYYPIWRHFCVGARTVIFVVDSCDRENMEHVHYQFWRMLEYDELTFKEILIYATKQDIPNAMTVYEISEKLELGVRRFPRHIRWYVQECSGKTGSGLSDGLSWIALQISKRPSNRKL